MTDLPRAIDGLGRALDAAEVLLVADERRAIERRLDEIARRHGFLGPTVVAALAGGTGSGKSSLLNALAGEPLTDTGVLRPTTDQPTAWVPLDPDPQLLALLDEIGIARRIGHGAGEHLAIVDLPDLDSVELDHQATVDALLPRLDVVVWVLDPLKYNDRVVHRRIAERSAYAVAFLFVLNQVDRLRLDEVEEVVADLRRSLVADGIRDPEVLTTAAAPPGGAPEGVDALADRLRRKAKDKRLLLGKLTTDLRRLADDLEAAAGAGAADTDLAEAAWDAACDEAARTLARGLVDDIAVRRAERAGARAAVTVGSGPLGRGWHALRRSFLGRSLGLPQDEPLPDRLLAATTGAVPTTGAATALTRAVTDVSNALGGTAGRELRSRLSPADVESALRGAVEGTRSAAPAPASLPRRAWWVAAAALQTVLTLALLVGAAWWWIEPSAVRPGEVPWPAVLVLGGVALTLVVARLVRLSGRRLGRRVAIGHRQDLATALAVGIDERIGESVRDALEARRRFDEALGASRRAL